jgi:hypothetical protein
MFLYWTMQTEFSIDQRLPARSALIVMASQAQNAQPPRCRGSTGFQLGAPGQRNGLRPIRPVAPGFSASPQTNDEKPSANRLYGANRDLSGNRARSFSRNRTSRGRREMPDNLAEPINAVSARVTSYPLRSKIPVKSHRAGSGAPGSGRR